MPFIVSANIMVFPKLPNNPETLNKKNVQRGPGCPSSNPELREVADG
jgi:hypothetical protein